jgi:hypothetical protein
MPKSYKNYNNKFGRNTLKCNTRSTEQTVGHRELQHDSRVKPGTPGWIASPVPLKMLLEMS